MKNTKQELFKKAFKASMPVMAGYLVLGLGFGMIMRSHGLGIVWALCMSLFIYTGAMQYVAIDLISAQASFITIALTTLVVNARSIFYGISMLGKYKRAGAKKPYLISALSSETYSVLLIKDYTISKEDRTTYYFFVSLLDQGYWLLGTAAGSILGSAMKINTTGMSFALTALFLTILVEQWCANPYHVSTLLGMGVAILCLLIFGKEDFLIPAIIIIVALLTLLRDKEGEHYEKR